MRRVMCLSVVFCLLAGTSGWLSLGCSQEPATPEEKEKTKKPSKNNTGEPGDPLVIPALAFGPYTVDEVAGSGDVVFVEVGFFDRRVIKGTGDADIFDKRDRHAAVALMPASAAQAPGCAAVTDVKATEGDLKPHFTGDFDENLAAGDDGVWRFEDDDESSPFVVDGDHTITFSTDKTATLPDVPSYSGLVLAGAFDANLTINSNLGDINTALADSSDELLLGDSGGDYDVAVVIFHGGSGAKTAQIRCVFAAGDSAALPVELYKEVLPIRRMTGLVTKLGGAADGDDAPWRARFSGQSVEDLRVP